MGLNQTHVLHSNWETKQFKIISTHPCCSHWHLPYFMLNNSQTFYFESIRNQPLATGYHQCTGITAKFYNLKSEILSLWKQTTPRHIEVVITAAGPSTSTLRKLLTAGVFTAGKTTVHRISWWTEHRAQKIIQQFQIVTNSAIHPDFLLANGFESADCDCL